MELIKNAIYNLDVEGVRNIIDTMPYDEILNSDLMEYIVGDLYFTSGCRQTLNCLSFYDFSGVYVHKDVPCKKLLSILELILIKCPSLLKPKHLETFQNFGATYLIDLFRKHYVDFTDPENCCYVCFSATKKYMIDNVCNCNILIHLDCLNKLVKTSGTKCKICKKNYGVQIDTRGRLYYPEAGIYPSPLMSHYVFVKNEDYKTQLHYAIAYLQVNIVADILSNITTEQYREYVNTADYYALHKYDNGILKISDFPYTNFRRDKNNHKLFLKIELLLSQKSEQQLES